MHWLDKLQKINPEAAEKVRRRGYNTSVRSLVEAFLWSSTPEGLDYWADINRQIEDYEEEEKPVNKRHKHADLIIAWAEGAQIQVKNHLGRWEDCNKANYITWQASAEYRVKPKTRTMQLRVAVLRERSGAEYLCTFYADFRERERADDFVRWVTDIINVELEGD